MKLTGFAKHADVVALQQQLATGGTTTNAADTNSLIPGEVAGRWWADTLPAQTCRAQVYAGSGATYSDLVYLNYLADAPANGGRFARFGVPSGVTGISFDVPLQLPSGVSAATVELRIIKTSDGSTVATKTVAVTGALTTYSLTATVAAGTDYTACIYVNGGASSAQAQVLVGRIRLKATTGATGVFAADHLRYAADGRTLHDAGEFDAKAGLFVRTNPYTRMVLDTTALSLVIEGVYLPAVTGHFVVVVDGRVLGQYLLPANNAPSYTTVALPAGLKRVEVWAGSVNGATNASITGAWLRGVYVPAASQTRLVPPSTPAQMLVVHGDSISQGANSGGVTTGVWMRLRQTWRGNVASFGASGRSLRNDSLHNHPVSELARRMSLLRPSHIWLAMGTNDYGQNVPVADFQGYYATLLDELHARNPNARIYAQTPLVRQTETANSAGATLGDYRTAISNAVSTRPWATLVDGTAILTLSDLADGLHPNLVGHAKYADYVAGTLG